MVFGQMNYLPLAPPFFLILVGLFVLLLMVRAWRYAYLRLGLSPAAAMWQQVVSGQMVDFFGMRYAVPVVMNWPGTVIAVNVGGAVIPTLVSLYLLSKHHLWGHGLMATAVVAAVCYWLAQPVSGLGIALPVFVPALTTAIVALVLSRHDAAPLAYIGGSLGTLIGADLLNFNHIQGLGAPVASIGGAGTFDGIFLIGIMAVLLASISTWLDPPTLERRSA